MQTKYYSDNQRYTSAKTSINSTKVPSLFNKISWVPDTNNLDYGGGKFNTATNYLASKKVRNIIFDPYNQTNEQNRIALSRTNYDTATLSNVLNVIKEKQVRRNCIINCLAHLKSNGHIYISVYEGNKSGIGSETLKNSWQENRTIKSYMEELKDFNPSYKNGVITITKH